MATGAQKHQVARAAILCAVRVDSLPAKPYPSRSRHDDCVAVCLVSFVCVCVLGTEYYIYMRAKIPHARRPRPKPPYTAAALYKYTPSATIQFSARVRSRQKA